MAKDMIPDIPDAWSEGKDERECDSDAEALSPTEGIQAQFKGSTHMIGPVVYTELQMVMNMLCN